MTADDYFGRKYVTPSVPLFLGIDERTKVFFAMAGMKLAIVGSSRLSDSQTAIAAGIIIAVIKELKPSRVISGGAYGVDTLANRWALHLGVEVEIHHPSTQNWPAFKKRNLEIATACDALVRIVKRNSKTYGSGWTRDRAAEMGKPTKEFVID